MANKPRVLISGATGFIGAHTAICLLDRDYAVRATVRSMTQADRLHGILAAGHPAADTIEMVEASLEQDAGWLEAVSDCDYVVHVASPVPMEQPKNAEELIKPARDGSLRVLRAAQQAGVKRVVMTSSISAISGSPSNGRTSPYTAADWTDLSAPGLTPYVQSKTIAERAAWDFVADHEQLELATVNPGLVFGPVLEARVNASIEYIRRLLAGDIPAIPNIGQVVVDVRDVANLHVLALEHPEANGRRFIAANEFLWITDMAHILREAFGEAASKVPTRRAPNWLIRLVGLWDRPVRSILSELDEQKLHSNQDAVDLLGWSPRPAREAVISCAQSLLDHGLV